MAIDLSRISLRPFKLTDVDDFMLWAGDDQVTLFLRLRTFTSKEEALTFIKDVCIPRPWRRSICINDRSIGFVSIFLGSGDDRCRADMGYGIATKYCGQGITNNYQGSSEDFSLTSVQGLAKFGKVAIFCCWREYSLSKGRRKSWVPQGGYAEEVYLS